MKTFVGVLAFTASANALVVRTNNCCFGISSPGKGSVGQLSDGQNRLGGGLDPGHYCIDNGALTDGKGRGCILTPPTTQFQCDSGAAAQGGFSIDCNGKISYKDNTAFYECPTGENGGYNIYVTPPSGQGGCQQITLVADGCKPQCPAPPKTCPANLSGNYEFPHLIIPVDSTQPNKAFGTSYDGTITPTEDSLFLFDIPSSDVGKTCSLIFLLPNHADLQTSSYTLSGSGAIDFARLSNNANSGTTWNNKGALAQDYGITTVAPGGSYTIATFPCPANSQITFQLASSGGTCLTYFQDYNPSPIGLYITTC